jgi:hypothetical protein
VRSHRPGCGNFCIPAVEAVIFVALVLSSASLKSGAQISPAPELTPEQLVRAAVKNEVAAADNSAIKHMFRSRKQTPKGSQTKLYVETSDAMAGMLIAVNDQPLTAQEEQGETNHLFWLEGSPEQLRKKQAREKEDSDHSLRIVKALPDAFRYEYDGIENGTAQVGREGAQLVRLKFTPNPGYSPPSHVEQVLEGLQGYLLIDPVSLRLARIDGTLFREVTFGWGIVGHLDKGGHFRVQQADLGDGSWDITDMDLDIKGKILFFKSISMVSEEVFSDFHRVPDSTNFAQGVKLLQTEEQKLARSDHAPDSSQR